MRRRASWAIVSLGLVLVACSRSSPSTSPAPPPQAPPSGTIAPPEISPTAPPVLPHPITALKQGTTYWGVYVAVAKPDSPKLEAGKEQLGSVGVKAIPGSLACDEGAAEELGVADSGSLFGVAAYFASKAEADAFAGALDPPPVGVAKIRVFCAD